MPASLIQTPQPVYVDMNNLNGDPVIVVVAHITHLEPSGGSASTVVHFSGGGASIVLGTVNDCVKRFWPK